MELLKLSAAKVGRLNKSTAIKLIIDLRKFGLFSLFIIKLITVKI